MRRCGNAVPRLGLHDRGGGEMRHAALRLKAANAILASAFDTTAMRSRCGVMARSWFGLWGDARPDEQGTWRDWFRRSHAEFVEHLDERPDGWTAWLAATGAREVLHAR